MVAPIVHNVGHALERASMMHVHGKEDGGSLREGCDPVSNPQEDCYFCLTKVFADLELSQAQESLHFIVSARALLDDTPFSQGSSYFSARAPPLFG